MYNIDDILITAANNIERDGWLQGSYGKAGGPQCVMGAITTASDEIEKPSLYHLVFSVMHDYLGESNLAKYNDAPGRTEKEVVTAMRKCAAQYKGD